jgi:hypothetical protein
MTELETVLVGAVVSYLLLMAAVAVWLIVRELRS